VPTYILPLAVTLVAMCLASAMFGTLADGGNRRRIC
jgi:hypothetical protein